MYQLLDVRVLGHHALQNLALGLVAELATAELELCQGEKAVMAVQVLVLCVGGYVVQQLIIAAERNTAVQGPERSAAAADVGQVDVHGIAECAHRRRIPLILDEAHGAHFGFHPYFPKNGNDLGADIVIHSLHKTLPSLTQTALLHMNGTIIDRDRVNMYLDILQSSSPSYVLMASIDECVRLIEEKRVSVFSGYVDMLQETREQLKNMEHLRLWESPGYDRSKILISTAESFTIGKETNKYTGKQLYTDMMQRYFLQFEMAAPNYAIAMTAPGDIKKGMRRLTDALKEIDSKLAKPTKNESFNAKSKNDGKQLYENIQIYPCGEINKLQKKRKKVSLNACAGYISTEYAYIYPPGIPLIVPGEQISEKTMNQIIEYHKTGFEIRGIHETGSIEVLDNG